MPDDYYVSQYSGEEIDALLGGAGAGTVRYDAAQTLADEQKTQARANIAAAPDGYGLGTINVNGESYDANNCTQNGWYVCTVNTPNSEWWYILTVSNYSNAFIVQKAWYYNGGKVLEAMRLGWLSKAEDQGGGWQPWEWVNPPMQVGVEYRTTERYLGKPVYTQIINCGSMPDIGSEKTTSIAALNVGVVTFISGWCTHYGSVIEPNIFGMAMSANKTNIRIVNLSREVNSNAVMYTLVKYTKTTD